MHRAINLQGPDADSGFSWPQLPLESDIGEDLSLSVGEDLSLSVGCAQRLAEADANWPSGRNINAQICVKCALFFF